MAKEQNIIFTDTDESGNKVMQFPLAHAGWIDGLSRTPETAYAVGNTVICPYHLGLMLQCTTAGTTSNAKTIDTTSVDVGDTIKDGSVKWTVVSTFLMAYPVGSLYWSENDTDPATLFGGTWEQIKDKFILAAGDTYTQGASGGAATVTLTTNQIPSHNHTGTATTGTTTDHIHGIGYNNGNNNGTRPATAATGTTVSTTLDSKASYTRAWNGSGGTNTLTSVGTTSGAYAANEFTTKSVAASSGTTGSHSHTVTINSTGGGAAHNNMPPYVTYYCWKRTA